MSTYLFPLPASIPGPKTTSQKHLADIAEFVFASLTLSSDSEGLSSPEVGSSVSSDGEAGFYSSCDEKEEETQGRFLDSRELELNKMEAAIVDIPMIFGHSLQRSRRQANLARIASSVSTPTLPSSFSSPAVDLSRSSSVPPSSPSSDRFNHHRRQRVEAARQIWTDEFAQMALSDMQEFGVSTVEQQAEVVAEVVPIAEEPAINESPAGALASPLTRQKSLGSKEGRARAWPNMKRRPRSSPSPPPLLPPLPLLPPSANLSRAVAQFSASLPPPTSPSASPLLASTSTSTPTESPHAYTRRTHSAPSFGLKELQALKLAASVIESECRILNKSSDPDAPTPLKAEKKIRRKHVPVWVEDEPTSRRSNWI